MAYDEKLADRIREKLVLLPRVEEKQMMGGLVFMYNDKMCVGILRDEMMCRIDPEMMPVVLEMNGCRGMEMAQRPMKGYVLVDDSAMRTEKEFDHWINLCLEFNPKARSSKKK